MKKNDWIFLLSILLYSILFWKEMLGLNVFIFSGVLLAGQVLIDRRILKIRSWLLAAAGTMCAAFCVFYYGNLLSIFATFFSLLITSYFAFNQKGSVLVGVLSSVVSILASIGYMVLRVIERQKARGASEGGRTMKRMLIVVFALLVVLVFFFMYRDSSVLFLNLTKKINFDWISAAWIGFTILGALVVYGFYFHNGVGDEWDGKKPANLNPGKEPTWTDRLMSIDSERFSGIVLLSLLNIMLLVVNGLDFAFIFGGDGNLPQGASCMQYVHQGVGTLIFSIVLALFIILFYFRGRMNFAENGKALRTLALIWIVQNALMLFSTAWRNEVYVLVFGLTYKRIGVYVYLVLTLIGLLVTAWKVQGKKTNIFLVRMNSWLFYGVWIIACFVNWDGLIVRNNLGTGLKPDLEYLNSLSHNALPGLVDYSVKHPQETAAVDRLTLEIPEHVYVFLNKQKQLRTENKWPSYVFKADKNYRELKERKTFGKATRLNLQSTHLRSIYYFPGFKNITAFEAGNNQLTNAGELGKFPNLHIATLAHNPGLTSLAGIENASTLEYLDLAGTNISDFTPLLKLKNLKRVNIDTMSQEWQDKLRTANPGLDLTVNY
jgi:hypothetical protein